MSAEIKKKETKLNIFGVESLYLHHLFYSKKIQTNYESYY